MESFNKFLQLSAIKYLRRPNKQKMDLVGRKFKKKKKIKPNPPPPDTRRIV
jgi:hypothetical protein